MRGAGGDSGSSLLEESHHNSGASWEVQCYSLASLARAAGIDWCSVALLKIDVEGAESIIMEGLIQTVTECRASGKAQPPIWLSLHVGMWSAAQKESVLAALPRLYALYAYVYDDVLQPLKTPATPSAALDGIWNRVTLLLANDAPAVWPQQPHHVTPGTAGVLGRGLAAPGSVRGGEMVAS